MLTPNDTVELTASIVAAYVSHNPVSVTALPELISTVAGAIAKVGDPAPAPAPEPAVELTPAVPIRKSITPDYIICLDDGKKFKSLRRHIAILGYTPESYKRHWGLPADYPLVAPNYAVVRSNLAIANGLGRKA